MWGFDSIKEKQKGPKPKPCFVVVTNNLSIIKKDQNDDELKRKVVEVKIAKIIHQN